jgi:type IV pilus assembly protein PilY1
MDGIGSITTNVAKLQDRNPNAAGGPAYWLYFGTGRYFYGDDDRATQRRLFGIKDPCYLQATNRLDTTCTTSISGLSSLQDQSYVATNTPTSSLASGKEGWYVNLAGQVAAEKYGAERSVTDPVAMTNGALFFTTFMPTTDRCGFGGYSFMWALRYNTGYLPSCESVVGKALVQVSTGSFQQISLEDVIACTQQDGSIRRPTPPTNPDPPPSSVHQNITIDGVSTAPPAAAVGRGKPPGEPPPIVTKSNLKPVKKILHIQEK